MTRTGLFLDCPFFFKELGDEHPDARSLQYHFLLTRLY